MITLKATTNIYLQLKESLNKAHNKSIGPDKIHYQFLKELLRPSIYTDTKIFERQ